MEGTEVFKTLNGINVNSKTEKKNNLTYLSWAYAWETIKKEYPDASYRVTKNDEGLPYFESPLGFMCMTEVTIQEETIEMWLPVMDGANKAMKQGAYAYKVKDWDASRAEGKDVFKEKACEAATMFDVNKTIMRCLAKNLAMFGLGLYIYAGEDLPTGKPMLTTEQYEIALKSDKKQIEAVLNKFEMSQICRVTLTKKLEEAAE